MDKYDILKSTLYQTDGGRRELAPYVPTRTDLAQADLSVPFEEVWTTSKFWNKKG